MAKKIPLADATLYGPAPGREKTDSTPVAIPLGFTTPETLEQTVARLVRSEQLAALARETGVETFEEFEDFGDESDEDPSTPFEVFYDPLFKREVSIAELRRMDSLLRQGAPIDFSEEDALALRRHLRQVKSADLSAPEVLPGSPAAPSGASGAEGAGAPGSTPAVAPAPK